MAYVALQHLVWGDGYLEPGDEIPEEDGRDYGAMLHLGQIAERAAVETTSDGELRAELEKVTAERDAALAKLEAGMSPSDAPDPPGHGDALPEGVIAEGGGWFLLPDGSKVRGRKAVDAALAK